MNTVRRPIPVLVVACLFLAVGVIGVFYHIHDLRQPDGISTEFVEALAILAGAFMLRGSNWARWLALACVYRENTGFNGFGGSNWARWLALAWMGFHVVLSALGAVRELVIHSLILAGIAWLLFLPQSRRYFGRARNTPQ